MPLLPREDLQVQFGSSVPLLHPKSCQSGKAKLFLSGRLGVQYAQDVDIANGILKFHGAANLSLSDARSMFGCAITQFGFRNIRTVSPSTFFAAVCACRANAPTAEKLLRKLSTKFTLPFRFQRV